MAPDAPIVRLQGSYAYYPADGGRVELASIVMRKRFLLSGPETIKIVAALNLLARGISAENAIAEIQQSSGLALQECESLLSTLASHNALVHRTYEQDRIFEKGDSLYDRQIRFFRQYESDEVAADQMNARLQNRRVLVVGVGGVGGWIALMCARMGVASIVAVDPDRVEKSNLHRQVLYKNSDIGRLKVEAARDALAGVDEGVRFEGHPIWIHSADDLIPLLRGVDFIFNPFGYVPSLAPVAESISEAAVRAGVPSIAVSVVMVGPMTVPGETACYHCAWLTLSQTAQLDLVAQAGTPGASRGEVWPWLPALAPRQAMAASIAVWEAARYLAGLDRARTLDGVLSLDTTSWEQHTFSTVKRHINCPICSKLREWAGSIYTSAAAGS